MDERRHSRLTTREARAADVYQIAKPTAAIKLLHWTKELPRASDADPLGLELRLSARLSNELLFCITSITPRARYYAFFPWAFQDYNEHELQTKSDRGRIQGVLMRERAMVLGAVLHHDGAACTNGGLGGTDKAIEWARKSLRTYDLSTWRHLGNAEGQFGAAYKGSLINLGVFKTDDAAVSDEVEGDTAELSEQTQSIDVRDLSPLGKRLADAFQKSVQGTAYVSQQLTRKDKIAASVLKEFGGRAGLCEILHKNAKDRDVLLNVFFAQYGEMKAPGHQRRRMSLLLLLECVGRARKAGAALDNRTFNDLCYYGAMLTDGDPPKVSTVKMPVALQDIQERWRIFFTQWYFAVAMQSFLVACVRHVRDRQGGVSREQLMRSLNAEGLAARFQESGGQKLPRDFFQITARDTLALCGITFKDGVPKSLPIEASLSERQLQEKLVKGEANEAAGVVLAAMLLYQVAVRHEQRVPAALNNWYDRHVQNRYADLALPVVLQFLRAEFGDDWLDRDNAQILDRLIWRFVIRQHQTMSYERGFGGGAPLFHVDGMTVIGTNTDYTDPQARNPRFWNALQILADLNLIIFDPDDGYRRTPEGDAWLAGELARAGSP
jgi:hypothetical protein